MGRLAGAVKRADTTIPLVWGEWAVVQNPSIPEVVLESDWQQSPRPVRNAAGRLEQYQRVYVLHQGPITTIVANPAQETDTGWVTVPLLSGFTGEAWVRRVGVMVELQASVTGTIPEGNTSFATCPEGFRPTGEDARFGAYFSGAYQGVGYVTAGGAVGVTQRTGTRTDVRARGTWLLN